MFARYLLAWLLLAAVAIGNGVLRQATYGKWMPELPAHQVSTATGILFIGCVVWWLHRRWPLPSAALAWRIGACWLVATVLFEFGFGHFVAGHSWAVLLADYNVFVGRIWLLFLAWVTVAPYVAYRLAAAGRA